MCSEEEGSEREREREKQKVRERDRERAKERGEVQDDYDIKFVFSSL